MAVPLIELPTQEFATRAAMLADQALAQWNRKRYVIILNDEDNGNLLTLSLFSNNQLILINRAVGDSGGGAVNGVPAGGTEAQVLAKNSDQDYDYSWKTITEILIPTEDSNELMLNDTDTLLLNDDDTLKLK